MSLWNDYWSETNAMRILSFFVCILIFVVTRLYFQFLFFVIISVKYMYICIWIFFNKYCHFLTFGRELGVLFFVSFRPDIIAHIMLQLLSSLFQSILWYTCPLISYIAIADFCLFSNRYTRRDVQRKRTMRARRTRHLKWQEVQDIVCSSRRNFTHVPLSQSLQPGKGRMAGKSRTVEVRFYKESRVLGCGDGGGEQGGGEGKTVEADASRISVFHDADRKIFAGASGRRRGRRDGFIYIMHSPFCCLSICAPLTALSPSFFLSFSFSIIFILFVWCLFRLVSSFRDTCISVFSCHSD